MNFRYPNITNTSPSEQLAQIKNYLYQLVEQLNTEAKSEVSEEKQIMGLGISVPNNSASGGGTEQGLTSKSTFSQIKSLIIKSADIVDAYYEEINKKLKSEYVAESEFGSYRYEAEQAISGNASNIQQIFASIQEIQGALDQTIETNASIRSGLLFVVGDETLEEELGQPLENGTEVYGLEIGQRTTVNGTEVFNKFARFTSYGMTLYDKNGNLTAYITDRKMNIPNAAIKNSMTRGGFKETLNSDGSSVERWVGVV